MTSQAPDVNPSSLLPEVCANKSLSSIVAADDVPAIIARCPPAATFAWHEFFEADLANRHTRTAYRRAVLDFLAWCEVRGLELVRVTPGDVGRYFDKHQGSIPTKKQHLAALRRFFDLLVVRHVMVLNPALSVRAQRYQVVEGKTPEFTVERARRLLSSIDTSHAVGLRDRAVIGVLIYTAARVGAVATLLRKDLLQDDSQWSLRFAEKGGKSREIPVRHDLQTFLMEYLKSLEAGDLDTGLPLFRTTVRRTKVITQRAMTAVDICRMVKRRLRQAGLPVRLSPHSFRVTTITDLLEQGVPIEDVQHLAGHADPRTTMLYDRRKKAVTRNIVERISV